MRIRRILYGSSRPSLYFSITGISMLRRRRFPASLSRRLMSRLQKSEGKSQNAAYDSDFCIPTSAFGLVMTRDGFDGTDDLLIRNLVGTAGEAGVATVHQDGPIALGVTAQGVDQLPPLQVVERTKVHGRSPS